MARTFGSARTRRNGLAGRASLVRGDATSAVALLASAGDGFAGIAARWEAALTRLWLGEAQLVLGEVEDARRVVSDAHEVFDQLRSVRERDLARSLLDRAG